MPTDKIIAIALIVVGVGLAWWGYQMSESVGSQLSSALTGSQGDDVMWRYIAGAVCIAVGGFLMVKK